MSSFYPNTWPHPTHTTSHHGIGECRGPVSALAPSTLQSNHQRQYNIALSPPLATPLTLLPIGHTPQRSSCWPQLPLILDTISGIQQAPPPNFPFRTVHCRRPHSGQSFFHSQRNHNCTRHLLATPSHALQQSASTFLSDAGAQQNRHTSPFFPHFRVCVCACVLCGT